MEKQISNSVDILLGLQWGDECKGKITDFLSKKYDIVARFQGGPNAGHTLEFGGHKIVLRTLPCAFGYPDTVGVMGAGMVCNPIILVQEIEQLSKIGIEVISRLYISRLMALIGPFHPYRDAAEEKKKEYLTGTNIGTTKQGISDSYQDKTGRRGLRMGDIFAGDFMLRFEAWEAYHLEQFDLYKKYYEFPDEEYQQKRIEWLAAIEYIRQTLHICDVSQYMLDSLGKGKKVLAEGAQGSMLDLDYGDYPNVTSSHTFAANAVLSLGIPMSSVGEIIGIIKLHVTKVGGGTLPSSMPEDIAALYREAGKERGAVTGRDRNCGWLDLVALRYIVERNGVTSIIIAKVDVCPVETINIAVAYKKDEQVLTEFPLHLGGVTCVLEEHKGWKVDLGVTSARDIPQNLAIFLNTLKNTFATWNCKGIKIPWLSTGPDRNAMVPWEE